jgi:hypothetical protein
LAADLRLPPGLARLFAWNTGTRFANRVEEVREVHTKLKEKAYDSLNPVSLNLVFVVVREGKEVHAVVTAPFDGPDRDVTSASIRVE